MKHPLIPRLDAFFGPWAMAEHVLAPLARVYVQMLADRAAVRQHVRQWRASRAKGPERRAAGPVARGYYRGQKADGGILVFRLTGVLMQHEASEENSTSTVRMRQSLRDARRDPEVKGVVLVIESPGGSVDGTYELAADFADLARAKPTVAYGQNLIASAAYWVGCQAPALHVSPTALVGSIGAIGVIEDLSGAAAQMGIKVHVISTGPLKGAGVPGTEITPAHLAYWQKLINAGFGHFADAVAQGRHMSPEVVKQLATGEVWPAAEALKLGLVDAVQSLDATMEQMRRQVAARGSRLRTAEARLRLAELE